MGKIIRFPVRKAEAGAVWCAPLQCYFPQVFRAIQIVTPAIADECQGAVAPGEYTHYTLRDDKDVFLGVVRFDRIVRLAGDAPYSLVIRWHESKEAAASYLDGVVDVGSSQSSSSIYEGDHNVFTLVERVTKRSWQAPMIVYVATYYDENLFGGFDIWEHSISATAESEKAKPSEMLQDDELD